MDIQIHTSPGFLNKKDFVIRHCIIIILAILFTYLGKVDATPLLQFKKFVGIFFNIFLIWNGNLLLIDIFDRTLSWEKNLKHKLLLSGTIALLWPIAAHFIYGYVLFPMIYGTPCELNSMESISYLIISIVITLFINSIFVATAFFKSWKQTLQEKEELKRERITAEFETLKNQINPHFLFNSLNTLTNLIEENPKVATDFVLKLSSVYRYVLTQRDKELVQLSDELAFVHSFIYLNKIRFGDNLQTHIHLDPKCLPLKMVTLSLQMLVENCIKHNIISLDKPLTIHIGITENRIFVRNNLQRKASSSDSNGIGLNNIVHRYSLLTKDEVDIMDDGQNFVVSLPLINS
jgi:hypothetical protein